MKVIFFLMAFYTKTTANKVHPRQARLCIRLPWINHVLLVFTCAYFAQILDTIVVLIAVDMVNLLLRKTALADRPDGMVQTNKDLSFTQPA